MDWTTLIIAIVSAVLGWLTPGPVKIKKKK